jgi:TolA-binding protein
MSSLGLHSLGAVSGAAARVGAPSGRTPDAPSGAGKTFQHTMTDVRRGLSDVLWPKAGLHQELAQIQGKIEAGKSFSGRELLLYQIKASRFHVQVEMLSKVAESMLGTLRKFQSAS